MGFFYLVGASGVYSLAAALGLLVAMTSLWGAQALDAWLSAVVAHGLSTCGSQAPEQRLSSCGS